jgi:surface carbohydrate biosynthesis protein (TIGR04326 family)
MRRCLFVVHRAVDGERSLSRLLAEGCHVTVVDLLSATGSEPPPWLRRCQGAAGVTIPDLRSYVETAAPRVRERFVRFVADWPNRRWRGRSFKERFTDNNLSLWWLTDLSEKNNEGRPTFTLLCDLEVIRLVVEAAPEAPFDRAVVVTDSRDFYTVCTRWLAARGVPVTGVEPTRRRDEETILALLMRRTRLFVSQLLRTSICRAMAPWRRRDPATARPAVAFYTWYPLQWSHGGARPLDRYYADLPEYLREHGGLNVVYAATFFGVPFVAHAKLLWRYFCSRSPAFDSFELVDRHLRLRDVVWVYWGSFAPWRYLTMELFNRTFRTSFAWDGVDLFEIFRRDLRRSFLAGIPDYLVRMRQMERFTRARSPAMLVLYLEVYCHGRAVLHGARRGQPQIVTIGYQHNSIVRNKLYYLFAPGELAGSDDAAQGSMARMPVPDRFALSGAIARDILTAGGFPSECAWVTGSARFDRLAELRHPSEDERRTIRGQLGIPTERTVVLVAGGYFRDITRNLLEQTVPALRARPEAVAIFKMHPFNRRDATEILQRLAREHRYERWTLLDMDLHTLLSVSDAMISSNSATMGEAIAMGVPVINLRFGYLDLSPCADSADGAWTAWDSRGIESALAGIAAGSSAVERVLAGQDAFVEAMFFKLDRRARDRLTERFMYEAARLERGPRV